MLRTQRREKPVEPGAAPAVIFTIAGNGIFGYTGDGGPAVSASLALPRRAALNPEGSLLIADVANHRIRRVDASTDTISTVAGKGLKGYSGDGGPAIDASLFRPTDVVCDRTGNIFVADQENHRIRRICVNTGTISTVAGNGERGYAGDGGPAAEASLSSPTSIALDRWGNLYVVDRDNHRIRKVDRLSGTITTVAGSENFGFSGDEGPATQASLTFPRGIDVDAAGNFYIADVGNNRIRMVEAASGIMRTLAGSGKKNFSGDGRPATAAGLAFPICVKVGPDGSLFIADRFNHRIRRVDAASGIITTVAGAGSSGFSGDRGAATEAFLSYPNGVEVDRFGRILIADLQNHRIRCVETAAQGIQELIARLKRLSRPSNGRSRRDARMIPLEHALHAVQTGDRQAAFRALNIFFEAIEADRGLRLTAAQADLLIQRASILPPLLTQSPSDASTRFSRTG